MMTKPIRMTWLLILLLLLVENCGGVKSASNYLIGLGSYDITGPAADVNMMGYANMDQIASGVHFRLRARAFIVAERQVARVVFVNVDACMASQLVTIKVLERLKARYGDLYTENNVAISGIHTHAGPGGYLQYVVYLVTSLGFVHQSFDALVDGIEQSIIKAHDNLRPGSIFVNKGELLDAGINRSPSGYLNNPAAERSKYKYDVDKDMTLLKFVDDEWGPVGCFNWFATHGTSMSRTNSLISGDNKGAAARFMEDWFDQSRSGSISSDESMINKIPRRVSNIIPDVKDNHHALLELAASFKSTSGKSTPKFLNPARRVRSALRQADRPRFVSAFCQTNCGDVSPNVLGAFCTDTGLPCDFNHSTCGGKNELCYGRGPGYPDEFESTRIIGERQFRKAVELFNEASDKLNGMIDYRHTYVDFSKLNVTISKEGGGTNVVKTCPASMGFAFAAGTTDGPGAFDFTQGDDKGNAFWRLVRDLLKTPNKEQVDCQHPKPILLDTGEMKQPYDWAETPLSSAQFDVSSIKEFALSDGYCLDLLSLSTVHLQTSLFELGFEPSILPVQILRIGQLVILSVPGEFTTMAGRRLRDAVREVLTSKASKQFGSNVHIVIAGLTNTYSQYVTTFEEYQMQRYEVSFMVMVDKRTDCMNFYSRHYLQRRTGASTLYGPHTLSGYIQEFKKLAAALISGQSVESGPQPPNLLDKQISFLRPVVMDATPIGVNFGDVSLDVPKNSTFKKGDHVTVIFWSACPRNDLMTEGTFALVEILKGKDTWLPAYDDDDFCLRFIWSRPAKLSTRSHATIEWVIPQTAASGVYRIRHFGAAKSIIGSIKHFKGSSSAFVVA
ncbi:neutral ceramidase [Phtheirospermum japonicum]|uniref:Neutral ceramidase n=1 Tax=Phtheirospermum japonicum TaxID=374723 RepID=A0A830CL35_9LAMI|nr:neutral ceramidase [Phtheirospermum japonicum]